MVNLGRMKGKKTGTNSCKLTHLQNLLLMIIVNTYKQDLSNFDWKYELRKVRASSVKSSSTLLFCSICEMSNRINRD